MGFDPLKAENWNSVTNAQVLAKHVSVVLWGEGVVEGGVVLWGGECVEDCLLQTQ